MGLTEPQETEGGRLLVCNHLCHKASGSDASNVAHHVSLVYVLHNACAIGALLYMQKHETGVWSLLGGCSSWDGAKPVFFTSVIRLFICSQ